MTNKQLYSTAIFVTVGCAYLQPNKVRAAVGAFMIMGAFIMAS